MGRFVALAGMLLLGLAFIQSGGGGLVPIEDTRLMWAALLPGIYLVGMLMLRD